jgi:hypothetical protein
MLFLIIFLEGDAQYRNKFIHVLELYFDTKMQNS